MRLDSMIIKSYRGLKNTEISNVNSVNIIVGKNNTGKTSVLEAIRLIDGKDGVKHLIDVSQDRESSRDRMGSRFSSITAVTELSMSFDYRTKDNTVDVCYKTNAGDIEYVVDGKLVSKYADELEQYSEDRINYYFNSVVQMNPATELECIEGYYRYSIGQRGIEGRYLLTPISRRPILIGTNYDDDIADTIWCRYVSPLEIYNGRYGIEKAVTERQRKEIIKLLQVFDKNILGYDKSGNNSKTTLFINIKDVGMIPAYVFGDGVKRILALASALFRAKDGILLIDEFEIGIHKEAMREVASWLVNAAKKNNTQIFLTTHSAEAIEAFNEANVDKNILSAYRLDYYNLSVIARYYSGDELKRLINDLGANIL